MSAIGGTKRTNPTALAMSVDWGRPEWLPERQTDGLTLSGTRFDGLCALQQVRHRSTHCPSPHLAGVGTRLALKLAFLKMRRRLRVSGGRPYPTIGEHQ